MIAATLIVGMTFQVAVNPPGGVWDEDKATDACKDKKKMLAGTSIMAHYYPEHYEMYMAYNLVFFFGSLCMVLLGVSGVPFVKRRILMYVGTNDYHVDNINIHCSHLLAFCAAHLTLKRQHLTEQ